MASYEISASGIRLQQQILDTVANNISNVNTLGYKARRAEAADIKFNLHHILELQTGEDDPQSAGGLLQATTKLWAQGPAQITDRELDVAVFGEGFLRVNTGAEIAYTRSGSLNVDEDGMLVTSDGAYVLGVDGAAIQVPEGSSIARIDDTGNVLAVEVGGVDEQNIGQIGLARFENPQGLLATGDSLFSETEASGVAIAGVAGGEGYGRVVGGVLEMSNVDLPDEMTRMIEAQRAYQLNINALQTLDEMVTRALDLRR
ncbi:MAG: flagellar hook-basal body protein [Thermomicrobiales bacterium]